jgi:hypothetical protein
MNLTPRMRLTVTSSLCEISTDQLGHTEGSSDLRGGGYTPFLQQDSGQIFKDDVEGFFSILDIFFTSQNKTKNKAI